MSEPITHILKIKKVYHDAIRSGDKTFEVRHNDRNYQKGDCIQFCNTPGEPPIRDLSVYQITNVHSGLGMKDGYVVLAIREANNE